MITPADLSPEGLVAYYPFDGDFQGLGRQIKFNKKNFLKNYLNSEMEELIILVLKKHL